MNGKLKVYFCKLHLDIESIYLESIERHCEYEEPQKHKAEILKLLELLLLLPFSILPQ